MEIGGSHLECSDALDRLRELRRGRLDPARRDAAIQHLRGCASCRRLDEEEALLDRLLRERLPPPELPADVRMRLEALCVEADARPLPPGHAEPARSPPRGPAWRIRRVVPVVAASAMALLVGLAIGARGRSAGDASARLVGEAVTDHLRAVTALHPLDVASDDSHNVKPWFEGRIDFAPTVPDGPGELRLRGGSVGYFLDRKAAVITYTLRQHAVTLLAFPTAGIDWPASDRTLEGVPVRGATRSGVHVALWRHGDVGYAVVADVNPEEFQWLAGRLARTTAE